MKSNFCFAWFLTLFFCLGNTMFAADAIEEPQLILDTGAFLSEISDITFSPDGQNIAVAGDKLVRIFAAQTGELRHTLRGDRSRTAYGEISCVTFSPDGHYLLVGIYDYHARGSIRMYKTNEYSEIHKLLPGHAVPTRAITFSRNGQYMASVDVNGEIALWDWTTQTIVKRIPPRNPQTPIVDDLQFADADPVLISIEADRPHIYRVPDGKDMNPKDGIPPKILGWLFDIDTKRLRWPQGTLRDPRVFDFHLDRDVWAAAGAHVVNQANKYWIGLWKSREMNRQSPPHDPFVVYEKHRWEVAAVALSPLGDLAASGDKFGEVHVWNARTGQQLQVITSPGNSFYEVAFDSNSDRILFGTEPNLATWDRNNYGSMTRVLDLRKRVIQQAASVGDIPTLQEQTQLQNTQVTLAGPKPGEEAYHIIKQEGGKPVSAYRLGTGRNPTVYTLLKEPKLGVEQPILFADNLGYLALWNSAGDEMQRFYGGHRSMITAISPAANGNSFITSSTDRTLRLWSLTNYEPTGIMDFKYENSVVVKVPPGSSSAQAGVRVGDKIISVDGKTVSELYELMLNHKYPYKPGQVVPVKMQQAGREFTFNMTMVLGFDYSQPILNIYLGEKGSWILWTPQGYYDCSPGADQMIGWHVNRGPDKSAQYFPVQQFRKKLYRPDIIDRIIETGNVASAIQAATAKRPQLAKKITLTDATNFANNTPPVTTITAPQTGQSLNDPRIDLKATVQSTNGLPILSVTLLHNGTPAKVFKPANEKEAQHLEISHRMRLFSGRNELALIAENASATSDPKQASLELIAPQTAEKSQVHVLAIGIGQYKNSGAGFSNLKYAAVDAQAFADTAKSHENGQLYSSVQTKVLLNEEATRENILSGFEWLVEQTKPNDVIMLFFSGHGFVDDKDNFYLASHDVAKDKLRATGISWRELTRTLHEDLPACKRLVFLDACHSAGVMNSEVRSPLHELAAPELGTIFYCSSTFQEESLQNEDWKHGAFTKAILDVLGDAKSDILPRSGDGLLNTLELEAGVTEKVQVMTRDKQHPVVFSPETLRRFNILELKK